MAGREQLDFSSPRNLTAQWYGVLVGPVTFGVDLLLSYSLVPHACSTGHHYVLHVVTAASFLVVATGLFTSLWLYQHIPGLMPERGDVLMSRPRFMALLGIVLSLYCEVLIIANAFPRFMLNPCD
jgi:hypothetical protein